MSIVQPYADASEGKRMCWKICLLNAGVWAAWKIKRWQPFMIRSFMHHPLSGLSTTLVTSMFRYFIFFSLDRSIVIIYVPDYVCVLIYSHMSFMHLLFNCLALESFGKHIFRVAPEFYHQ